MSSLQRQLCVVAGLFCSTLVWADTTVLTPVADTTLYEMSNLEDRANGAGAYLFFGRIRDIDRRRALLRFNVAGALPAGSLITSVQLNFAMDQTISGTVDASLHRVTSSWSEGNTDAGPPGGAGAPPSAGDATWFHRNYPSVLWATPGGDFNATPSATIAVNAPQNYAFTSNANLVSDVQAWLDNPTNNFGWMLRANELTAPPSAKRIGSRENTTASSRPQLVLGFTPPPRQETLSVPLSPWSLALLTLLLWLLGQRAWKRSRVA